MSVNVKAQISATKSIVIIHPVRGWNRIDLREIWAYRDLIWTLIARDFKARFRQRALGWLWFVINPFVSMIVLSFLYGGLLKVPSDSVPYPLFLFSGTLPWAFFTNVSTGATSSLGNFLPWLSKVYFPRLVAPIVTIATNLIDWSVQLILLFLLMLYYQVPLRINILTLPLFLLIAGLVGTTVGLWVSALAIRYRDLPGLVSYGMTIWYYVTPVLYSTTVIPSQIAVLYELNPMYWVIQGFRWGLLGKGRAPEPILLLLVGFFLALFVTGLYIFERTSRNVVDIL